MLARRRTRMTMKQNNTTSARQAIRPNSSPTTAKVKSECASGRICFASPPPGPVPMIPPFLKACVAVSTWNVSPFSG